MTLQQLIIFLPAALLLGASPGANNLLAFISATKAGWLSTAKSILGRLAAWAVLVVLVSLGLDVLLRTSEMAFVALKWVGVGYLLFLAFQFWTADVSNEIKAPDVSTLMRREFLTLMGNPKAYLLLTAFLPQFVNDTAPLVPQLFLLGALYLIAEGIAALLWVSAGSLVGAHALTPLRRQVINRASAGLMGTAALLLARTERTAQP
ncbi:LysE family translocator [Yoonia sp. 2307UL14-13]|uniref:LysE family translocator n=1 Tax=Yoonia sp. 2307UL14-13 TaxID=3126506 RepID=UPI0030AB3276